jgi:hypothetical protein
MRHFAAEEQMRHKALEGFLVPSSNCRELSLNSAPSAASATACDATFSSTLYVAALVALSPQSLTSFLPGLRHPLLNVA